MHEESLRSARILIVDDEAANVRLLELLLEEARYTSLKSTTNPRQVLALFAEFRPDLILLDLLMPGLDGFAVMEQLKPLVSAERYLPILVLTADVSLDAKRRALSAGAQDFVTKPFDTAEVLLRVRNLLETRLLHRQLQEQNRTLEQTVHERTQQLLQTEKLAAMGQLLAGVAHELNNPLAVVMGRAALLSRHLDGGPLARQTETLAKAAERCARIVKNFLALARHQPPERQRVSLNQAVEDAVELLAYPLRVDNVEVRLELAPDLPQIWADPHQLHQVVVNLVSNAHQAMRGTPAPHRVSLRTRRDSTAARVELEVADTGPGIPPEIQAKIFKPFFTTKPAGEGTGLGLSLCHGIVEGHRGSIRLASVPGQGAVFLIDLPIDPRQEERPVTPAATALSPSCPRTMLVVDDEVDVADMLADLLRLDGHHVEIAGNGRLALDRLRERNYDLVLSDVRMPELDGPGLYQVLESQQPGLRHRLIFLTGDALSSEVSTFLERTPVQRLAKPFTLEEVRRVLQRAEQGS